MTATPVAPESAALIDRAKQVLETLDTEQVEELRDLLDQIDEAIADSETEAIAELQEELADFIYYVTT